MALTSIYIQANQLIPALFDKIRTIEAPDHFSVKTLKEWGFTSSSNLTLIPLMKELGFVSGDGSPTLRYLDYQDSAKSAFVLGEAIKEAYGDLLAAVPMPDEQDKGAIQSIFRTTHNVPEREAKLMALTFFALLELSDLFTAPNPGQGAPVVPKTISIPSKYHIQIQLPESKDPEVYDAIFRSLKKHLLEK